MPAKAQATTTTDHEEIRRWAEERGAKPACVRNTGDRNDVGILRLEFPGYSGEESLQPIDWDLWFEKFDQQGLALLHQETTAEGQKSNFNKLVNRETASRQSAPAHHSHTADSKIKSTSAKSRGTHSAQGRSEKPKTSKASSKPSTAKPHAPHKAA